MIVTLDYTPSIEDFRAALFVAGKPCECDPRLELVRTEIDESLCKPCQARKVLNRLAELSENL